MNNVLLGVALLPDQPTIDAATAIGRAFVGPAGSARWCELVREPYCLVYHSLFSRDLSPLVLEVVRGVAAEESVIQTSLVEFGIQDGHLSWITSHTEWRRLRALQAKVLAALGPRRAIQSVIAPSRQGGRDALRENLDRYGYRYCDELFVPQVRLAYLSDLASAMSSLHRLTPATRDCQLVRMAAVALSPETGTVWPLAEAELVA
jgi:hypothetical protein